MENFPIVADFTLPDIAHDSPLINEMLYDVFPCWRSDYLPKNCYGDNPNQLHYRSLLIKKSLNLKLKPMLHIPVPSDGYKKFLEPLVMQGAEAVFLMPFWSSFRFSTNHSFGSSFGVSTLNASRIASTSCGNALVWFTTCVRI
jgi:hypothetical protein